MYFARFVVLGEGSSEEVVIPLLAEALDLPIDRSFVALVPLGGRHVNHLWRLLTDLDIPHATLLDLDAGRAGGRWGRIKIAYQQLMANGTDPAALFSAESLSQGVNAALRSFDAKPLDLDALKVWTDFLRKFGVFFCSPLDLDWSMLTAYPDAYRVLDAGMTGPSQQGDAKLAALGEQGQPTLYDSSLDDQFRWYRFLFLGRGKPSTHVRVLSHLYHEELRAKAPADLVALITYTSTYLFGPPETEPGV
jgi:putative ATP-dependent endonuclease of the OLD family